MNSPIYETIVIGGGQAGLSVGYHLKQQGVDFLILDASERIGDAWRQRWYSLRLFTPARYCGLDGLPFPAPPHSFPTKDEMAAYLQDYAQHFGLPVRSGSRVERLSHDGERFVVATGDRRYLAENVVVAMAEWQQPRRPPFAAELDASIVQLHSRDYRSPDQLQPGSVLVVGAANSGAEIALDVVRQHETWLSGETPGQIPFRIEGFLGRHLLVTLVLRGLFHRLATVNTPIGRKLKAKLLAHGMPLVRTKAADLEQAGIQRLPRTTGVQSGQPQLADGRVLQPANVIWCTGYRPAFSWIDLPVFGPDGRPQAARGVVAGLPGLYFVGQTFTYAVSSSQIHGVGRDARYAAEHVAGRLAERGTAPRQAPQPAAK